MSAKAFGISPAGKRKERIASSPNFRNGQFQNLSPTDMALQGTSYAALMWKFVRKPKNTEPPAKLPHVRTDLNKLNADTSAIVWFGHSSYTIKSQGKTILIDPVFSGNASPVSFFAKAFRGADAYTANDFDTIDLLIITHDHYDHLDHKTITALAPKVKMICTSLGVGAHLEHWGISTDKIIELDWWETSTPMQDMTITAAPARHFSGRSLKRNLTLWSSFVLQLHGYNIYLGGDSGYDSHFKKIGERFGPFDIALLENGQYGENWPLIHMTPEEGIQAALDLKTRMLMPIHWAKFSLALHAWDDSIKRSVKEAKLRDVKITTPQIGEPVILNSSYPQTAWWEKV